MAICTLHALSWHYLELDEDLLSAKTVRQRWKSAASRAECRAAYEFSCLFNLYISTDLVLLREAMAEMETNSDIIRAENAVAAALERDGDQVIANVFEGGASITAARDVEVEPQYREPTPRSDKMQVDEDEF